MSSGLMSRARSADGLDRQLANGYRARAIEMANEAAELRKLNG
jgi:hypothetical protein